MIVILKDSKLILNNCNIFSSIGEQNFNFKFFLIMFFSGFIVFPEKIAKIYAIIIIKTESKIQIIIK